MTLKATHLPPFRAKVFVLKFLRLSILNTLLRSLALHLRARLPLMRSRKMEPRLAQQLISPKTLLL
nr:MAG TPA: hypothetical protein [Caudoviricetes sp.]